MKRKPTKHYYKNMSHRAKVELTRSIHRLAALYEARWTRNPQH